MSRRSAWVPFLLAWVVAVAPWVATAAGLVPCNGIDCQACYLIDLIQNIINFCIGVSIPIAMALFAWAGILYFTSAEQQENITKAKSIFRSVLVGFIIVLGAYLIVETLLHAILNEDYWSDWNSIECVDDSKRQTNGTITDLLDKVLGQPTPLVISTPKDTTSTYAISSPSECSSAGLTYDSQTNQYYCTSVNPVSNVGVGDCSPSNLNSFGSNAATMSCILQAESSCIPTRSGDKGFSIGLAQINMTANNVTCNGQTYNCPTAFSEAYTCKNGVCTNPQVKDAALAAQCKTLLQNPDCNLQTAAAVLDTPRGLNNWTTYGSCK